jgi:enamine deaminase RidA (YjgF/YER057c/UK114 family)
MSRKLISPGSSFEKSAGYSRAVVQKTKGGTWCFVSGTTGYDYKTMIMPGHVEVQALNALATIKKVLEEAGFAMEDVVRCRYYVARRAYVAAVFPILGQAFGEIRPAATMVVCDLIEPEMKIEIEVTALKAK